jgi:hypothetical protein
VQLAGGADFYAENVRVTPSSATLTISSRGGQSAWSPYSPTRRDTTLDTSAIRRLTVSGRERGATAARGFRNGLLIGVSVGVLVSLASYAPGVYSREATTIVLGGIGGVVFGAAGLALGAMAGTDEAYGFTTPAPNEPLRPRRL